jgi:aminomuconate-semialdehyde/2-hydroxymuconate-6-semialdehyde dehydrogenase
MLPPQPLYFCRCGNTVVCKPSEVTPRTASALARAFHELGAPPGVFNLVHGLGGEAGAALVAHPGARLLSFTGGTATGAAVAATAAPLFKRLSLELGGKNATIIFGDTPVERAVAAAKRAGFTNNGQVCLCGSRVLVQRGIFDAVVAGLAVEVAALRVGDPLEADVDVGPLSSAAHRDKVAGYIALGAREGGAAVAGGEGLPDGLPEAQRGGYYVRPTVFTGLDARTSRVAREEIFGPVVVRPPPPPPAPISTLPRFAHSHTDPSLPPHPLYPLILLQTVHPFDTEAEAISITNDSPYGLCANVWTQNVGVAHRVSRALEVGMVW